MSVMTESEQVEQLEARLDAAESQAAEARERVAELELAVGELTWRLMGRSADKMTRLWKLVGRYDSERYRQELARMNGGLRR